MCQHDWTECLKINKAAKFEVIRGDLYGGGGGGGPVCGPPPPPLQMSVQFQDFEEQHLYSLWMYNLKNLISYIILRCSFQQY